MRHSLGLTLLLLIALPARSKQPAPDAGRIFGNTFESEFFKFQYSFPKEWLPVEDSVRLAKNRKRHEEAEKRHISQPAGSGTNRTTPTSTQVFWLYDLLIASPTSFSPEGKPSLPYVSVWAIERNNLLNEAGDQAKLLSMLPRTKVLRQPEKVEVSGRKFVRADFIYQETNFQAIFVTVYGKYLLAFEFRGNNEKEINELAQTMQSVIFK